MSVIFCFALSYSGTNVTIITQPFNTISEPSFSNTGGGGYMEMICISSQFFGDSNATIEEYQIRGTLFVVDQIWSDSCGQKKLQEIHVKNILLRV